MLRNRLLHIAPLVIALAAALVRPAATPPLFAQDSTETPAPPEAPTLAPPTATLAPPTLTPVEVIFPTFTPTPDAANPITATAPISDGTWAQPINLSQSGAATDPVIAADAAGQYYALWWDNFEGTQFALYLPGQGWSLPVSAPNIFGARAAGPNSPPAPPVDLRLFADDNGILHAFWMDERGNVMYSQNNQRLGASAVWTFGLQVASAPYAWDAQLDADGNLHVAYIRRLQSAGLPAGVYYRQSITGGRDWENARAIITSLYFRTLPDELAHLNLATTRTGEVFVTWDDPQLFSSFTSRSADGGLTFEAPKLAAAEAATAGLIPQRAQLLVLDDGSSQLRLWQDAGTCDLYQERYDAASGAWTTPQRVLETLPGCLRSARSFALSEGRLLLQAALSQGSAVALWDGSRWSEPWTPRIGFVNPTTNRPSSLDCLTLQVVGEQVAALGCDPRGDIWYTTSQTNLADLLPALRTAWTPSVQLSVANAEAGFPSVTYDEEGRMHVVWAQSEAGSGEAATLYYTRGDGPTWGEGVNIMRSASGGPAASPVVVADGNGYLHAVWSGGLTGEILYSRTFARDAASTSGWQAPRSLPALRTVGGSPAMAIGPDGVLRVVYTIPLNEDRGVYYVDSADQGETWNEPVRVFGAAEADWPAVHDTQLAQDAAGRLHVVFVRSALPPAETRAGVYYVRSDDGGQTWTEPEEVSGGQAGYARIAAAGPDEIHRVWMEIEAGVPSLYHQFSPDGGQTWSTALHVGGLRTIAPSVGLVSDGAGAVYLVGIETTAQGSAALFLSVWDGITWQVSESIPLGYNTDAATGALALLLPPNRLTAFYRVTTSPNPGGGLHVLGFTERVVADVQVAPAPTFTPVPTVAPTITATTAPSATPEPTVNFNTEPQAPAANDLWLRIGGILAGMVVIFVVALIGLRAARR